MHNRNPTCSAQSRACHAMPCRAHLAAAIQERLAGARGRIVEPRREGGTAGALLGRQGAKLAAVRALLGSGGSWGGRSQCCSAGVSAAQQA